MRTSTTVLAVLGVLLLAPLGLKLGNKIQAGRVTTETVQKAYLEKSIPKPENDLNSNEIKLMDVKKVITLEDNNTVVFRGPVTGTSVAKAMKQLQAASRRISKNTPIYLVLDTPGGSIGDGADLIDFAKALPQKVHTVTLFAASMGFQIAQNLNTRYIITNGTLMSHRARVEALGGQIKGEFESRYKMVRRSVDYLDFIAAKRMSLEPKAYEALVFNEYWVYGFDAVSQKAADEEILIKCGESLDGTDKVEFETLFGTVNVTFSKCPLIKMPEGVELSGIKNEDRSTVNKVLRMSIEDKPRFIKEYISTDRFFEIFK